MHVVGDVCATHLVDRDPEVAREDLDSEHGLLLANTVKSLKATRQFGRRGLVTPNAGRVAVVIAGNSRRRGGDVSAHVGGEPVQGGLTRDSHGDLGIKTDKAGGIKVTKALLKPVRK